MKESQEKALTTKKPWEVTYKSASGIEIRLTPEIIKKYLIRGKSEFVTDQEMLFFMKICEARGLNPFIGDAYPIKYSSDPMAIVTSIDFFRKRARAQEDCKGWQKGIIVQGKEGIKYTHGLILKGEELVGGWFEATPEGWKVPFKLEVNLAGYLRYKKIYEGNKIIGQELTRFWEPENQPTMIAKVAEAQGLRTLWPDQFQQLFAEEEIEGKISNGAIDITPPQSFDELMKDKDVTMLDDYLNYILSFNPGKAANELKTEATQDFERFYSMFEKWRAEQTKDAPAQEEGLPTEKEEREAQKSLGMIPSDLKKKP